jgi:hypothetical protein
VVLAELGEPVAARSLLERALSLCEATYGPNHPWTARVLNSLGPALVKLGEPAAARPLLERALHIAETAYGLSHRAALAYRETLQQLDQSA